MSQSILDKKRAVKGDLTKVDYSDITVDYLKAACTERGIRLAGGFQHKHYYVQRLLEDDLKKFEESKPQHDNTTDPKGEARNQWIHERAKRRVLANEMEKKAVLLYHETMLVKMKALYEAYEGSTIERIGIHRQSPFIRCQGTTHDGIRIYMKSVSANFFAGSRRTHPCRSSPSRCQQDSLPKESFRRRDDPGQGIPT